MIREVKFESQDRRIKQILACLNKHGIEIYSHHMNRSYFDYDKIGLQLRLTT